MVMPSKNRSGMRVVVDVAVEADAQALMDTLSDWIDRLTQEELRDAMTGWLRRFLRTCRHHPTRPGDATFPKARNGCRSPVPAAGKSGNLATTLRTFATRLGAADGAELDTVVREFGRWVEARCGVPS